MTYDRDPQYLHPYLYHRFEKILLAIQSRLPTGHTAKIIATHRSPEDQFLLFKQGRTFRNGSWVRTGAIVTQLDGFVKKSRHNGLPATAFDTGIFSNNVYLTDARLYQYVAEGIKEGLAWGGQWKGSLIDRPHLEMPPSLLFKGDLIRDAAWLWQAYLVRSGKYTGAHDGYFGPLSQKALLQVTGERERNIKAWSFLFRTYGPLPG